MKFDEVKSALIEAANKAGLEEYEIYYMRDNGISAETLKNEIATFSSSVGGGVSFRCLYNGKMGYASSELFEVDEMKALVKRAMSNAENMDESDGAEIYKGSDKYEPLEANEFVLSDTASIKKTALELQEKTYACSEFVVDGTQSAALSSKIDIELINSHGLELKNSVGMSGVYVSAVVSRDGESENEFDFCEGFDKEKYEKMAEDTVKTALSKLKADQLESGKYDVVFAGNQMRSMLSAFASAFSGKEAYNGLSLLAGKVGHKIAADCVTIIDDPMREGTPLKTNFDGEGVATYRKSVVENGVLKTLLYDLATAKKAGAEPTGNGQRGSYASTVMVAPYNFYIAGGNKTLDELFSGIEKGVYITELKGLHAGANAVTGDFSIESAGFIIENGKLGKAVKSFTVAGNFFELLKDIENISDKVNFGIPGSFTVFGSPDVLVRSMSIAGK